MWGAVVHTHQAYASIFALINQPIPALFDEVALSIGENRGRGPLRPVRDTRTGG